MVFRQFKRKSSGLEFKTQTPVALATTEKAEEPTCWTPNLNTKPTVDARDTVSTPADPYGSEPTAEEIQARVDSLGRFAPRTQNAINPGDQDGEVGGDPNAAPPANLPDEDPVGDPGSPDGPSQPNA